MRYLIRLLTMASAMATALVGTPAVVAPATEQGEATSGRVGAESQAGVTRFWFSLPA